MTDFAQGFMAMIGSPAALYGLALIVVFGFVIVGLGAWLRRVRVVLRQSLEKIAAYQIAHHDALQKRSVQMEERLVRAEEQIVTIARHHQKIIEQLNNLSQKSRYQDSEDDSKSTESPPRRVLH